MGKQTSKRRHTLLRITVAAMLALSASALTFAQDKYMKPDLSALEEYYQVVKYEYDFNANIPSFVLVVKRKVENPPKWWIAKWTDADGIAIQKSNFVIDWVWKSPVDEPIRVSIYAPWKRDMPKVKSFAITEDPDR